MFGMFKKKARKAVVEVKKMENRDAVEATVWGGILNCLLRWYVRRKRNCCAGEDHFGPPGVRAFCW